MRAYCVANERFGQGDCNTCTGFPQVDGYPISGRRCFSVDLQLFTSLADQEASLGAGVLDGRAHDPVDELF